ncbi:MAG: hypothetical protein HYR67_20225 [Bacteroidetes bacterium]|nr:hypothetical protein [Bacteroidota bacterium]
MDKIAFVTSIANTEITSDDHLIVDQLAMHNVEVVSAPWDSTKVNWGDFKAIVFRSCWNYHHKPNEFNVWLEKMNLLNLPFLNPVKVVQWNLHKQYLFELQSKGFAVPPGILIEQNNHTSLQEVMDEKDWDKIVIKPAVSATAKDTWVASRVSLNGAQKRFNESLSQADIIIQKFIPEVLQHGEVSLIYINKHFSHAVLKKPKQGDFRVQNDFGGTVEPLTPSPDIIQQGEKIVHAIDYPLLYARVDGVISNGKLVLLELELIEPVLFLKYSAIAASLMAKGIIDTLKKHYE